mgnify:CR=1 FL=1
MTQTISACLIVKDEERFLESCLKSLVSVVQEIIIIDTGSTDETLIIAQKYGTVSTTPWEDDFSKARNVSIEKATGDWVLIIDADEVLTQETQEKLLAFLEHPRLQEQPIVLNFFRTGEGGGTFKRTLFRNRQGIHFIYPLHEILYRKEGLISLDCPHLSLLHHPRTQQERKLKAEKYSFQLEHLLRENLFPKENAHYSKHLGDACTTLEKAQKATQAYAQAYTSYQMSQEPQQDGFYREILFKWVQGLMFSEENDEKAVEVCQEWVKVFPKDVEGHLHLSYSLYRVGQVEESLLVYQRSEELLSKNPSQNFKVWVGLGRCYLALEQWDKGLGYLLKALKVSPQSLEVMLHLARGYELKEQPDTALLWYYKATGEIISAQDLRAALLQGNMWTHQECLHLLNS